MPTATRRGPERRLTSPPDGKAAITAQPPAGTGCQDGAPWAGRALSGQHPPWAQGPRDNSTEITKRNFQPLHPEAPVEITATCARAA